MARTGKLLRPDYGIDAPVVVRRFIVLAAGLLIIGYAIMLRPVWGGIRFGETIPATFISMGLSFALTAAVMLWGSRFGKLMMRDKILDSLHLRGDENILDVGCGHGLMLIGAAKRLTSGKAHGVDLWNSVDQANNSSEPTRRNAHVEGVTERIEIRDGDARALPYPDSFFDVVLSSWVIHNMKDSAERDKAIDEIIRVLKPGGRVAITDISHAREYARRLENASMHDVVMSAPNFLFVIPTYTVSATKP